MRQERTQKGSASASRSWSNRSINFRTSLVILKIKSSASKPRSIKWMKSRFRSVSELVFWVRTPIAMNTGTSRRTLKESTWDLTNRFFQPLIQWLVYLRFSTTSLPGITLKMKISMSSLSRVLIQKASAKRNFKKISERSRIISSWRKQKSKQKNQTKLTKILKELL